MSLKKVLSVFLCFAMLFGVITYYNLKPEAASAMTVTTDKSGHVEVGDTVTVTVAVPAGLSGADCALTFKKNAFSIESYTVGNIKMIGYVDTPATNRIRYAGSANAGVAAGTLFTATLKVNVANSKFYVTMNEAFDANDNEVTFPQVTITVAGHDAGTWKITKQATRTQAGEKVRTCSCGKVLETVIIPIVGSVKGDLNLDGFATQSDYTAIKQYMNGKIILNGEDFTISDMNNDGAVDAFDMFYLDEVIKVGINDDFEYAVTNGNCAKISGYNSSNANVSIPARIGCYTVTNIDNYAFKNNTFIKTVTLSTGVKTINYGAFLNCTALETVVLSGTVTSIGTYAFKGCSSLNSITIPASVTSINANSFSGCNNLTIYGAAGSYAETYANNNNISFTAI